MIACAQNKSCEFLKVYLPNSDNIFNNHVYLSYLPLYTICSPSFTVYVRNKIKKDKHLLFKQVTSGSLGQTPKTKLPGYILSVFKRFLWVVYACVEEGLLRHKLWTLIPLKSWPPIILSILPIVTICFWLRVNLHLKLN